MLLRYQIFWIILWFMQFMELNRPISHECIWHWWNLSWHVISIVTPISKKEVPVSCSDSRPISISPIFSKLLERIVYSQLLKDVTVNNILPERQSGFRKGHSTTTELANLIDDFLNAIDKSKLLSNFTRLFKAFRQYRSQTTACQTEALRNFFRIVKMV